MINSAGNVGTKKKISIRVGYVLASVLALLASLFVGQLLFMVGASRPLAFVGGLATTVVFAWPFISARLSEAKSKDFYAERARRE